MERREFLGGALSALLFPRLLSAEGAEAVDKPRLARITFYHPRVQPENDPRQRRITIRLLCGERRQVWVSRRCALNGTLRLSEKNGGHLITAHSKFYWLELDAEKFPFGQGCRGDAIVPFKTVAADPRVFPYGSRVFVPMFEMLGMPDGSVHDGHFTVLDVGGKVKGDHLDLAVRDDSDYRILVNKIPWKSVKGGHGLWVQRVG
ncbi:hypothetical protein HS125_10550 [bacterium]|nr:hypothetical protein [bacterium]